MATAPRRLFGLPDPPDTYVEIDPAARWTITDAEQYSKCGWTPFAGMQVQGQVRRVVLHGAEVVRDGQVTATPGSGRVLLPADSGR
jgi:carbamoyl-phosphate synthase/aspartate carbamoyltransferase/dihydroorotase